MIWKAIPGHPQYEVSTHGDVRVVHTGQVLKPQVAHNGYLRVGLFTNRRYVTCATHRLVLLAFVGPCPSGAQTRHLNGIRTDNRLCNLAWGTAKENAEDRTRHGRHWTRPSWVRGEQHGCAKLNETAARIIYRCTQLGMMPTAVSAYFGVSRSTVQAIRDGRIWRHVTAQAGQIGGDNG